MGVEFFVILVGAVTIAALARQFGLPAPLVVTGVAIAASLLPFVPNLEIDGHLLLNLALPPLLYSASLEVSFVSFTKSMPHIRRLGIWLVAVTTLGVGLVAWLVMPELGLAGALLLGAIVGPPDAVSASAVGRRLGLPRRVMTVMSGESLINDATSLTLVRVFAGIVAGASVSVWSGILDFVLAVIVGVAIGAVFGVVLHQLRMRVHDPVITGTAGLLVPFGAYAIAEQLHGSGVLAVVTMGLWVGFNAPKTRYLTRQQDGPIWSSVDFVLESFVFAYIGLQLPQVIQSLDDGSPWHTLLLATIVLLVVLLIRPIYVFASYSWGQYWQRRRLLRWKHGAEALRDRPESRRGRAAARMRDHLARKGKPFSLDTIKNRISEPQLSRAERAVVSWAGMRGVVTMALALALPDLTENRMPSTSIGVITVCAFVVTVGTLLLQGLTLAPLIRRLGVNACDENVADQRELDAVRRRSMQAGKEFLRLRKEEWIEQHGEESRELFAATVRSFMRVEKDVDRGERQLDQAVRQISYDEVQSLARGWLEVRRQVLLQERDRGALSEEVMRQLITAMDAEELALDTRGGVIGRSAPVS